MYKLKSGGIVGRPSRIDNTFIGSQTDLGPYGYYTVANPKPNYAPEGQRYEDSGNGTYDEKSMTYTADWVLVDEPTVPTPDYGTKITRLSMRNRFTFAEKVAIEDAAKTDTEVKVFMDDLAMSSFIDLSNTNTQQGVQLLEQKGLIATGRADEVLNNPVTQDEAVSEA